MIRRARFEWKSEVEAWQTLVHVCRRWRSLVFRSPRRLDLQLFCTSETPAKDTLDVWPALPLTISSTSTLTPWTTDNIIVALRQSRRVYKVDLFLTSWKSEEVLAVMQAPFPELTDLKLISKDERSPVIPDSFLGGFAPRLQFLNLSNIIFPGNLLLSATQLVRLELRIPHSGYISPEAMIAPLSMLSKLEVLFLTFQSSQSRPDWGSRSPPRPERPILPALHRFYFKGVTEYLEDLVTHIDAPQLKDLHITFFNQIDFDCPRLAQFINRTLTLRPLDEAHVEFYDTAASIRLLSLASKSSFFGLQIYISCREPDWQLSSIEQVCNSLHSLSMVEDLYIGQGCWRLVWKNDVIENSLLLRLLLPFTAVKNLYLSEDFAPFIAAALRELVGDRVTEVLPSLQNIFVRELEPSWPFRKNIRPFVAARQLFGHPIAISSWRMR